MWNDRSLNQQKSGSETCWGVCRFPAQRISPSAAPEVTRDVQEAFLLCKVNFTCYLGIDMGREVWDVRNAYIQRHLAELSYDFTA